LDRGVSEDSAVIELAVVFDAHTGAGDLKQDVNLDDGVKA